MRHRASTPLHSRTVSDRVAGLGGAKSVLILAAFVLCLPPAVRAGQQSSTRDQFARAVRMRTMLEGLLPRDRAVGDYQKTIEAYQKVYLLSTQAPEVTPSLIAEAELYREMGQMFDKKYFQSSIDMYRFLLAQYPETRYRGEALFAIAQIQQNDQKNLDAAEASYKEFLKRFPENNRAADARQALIEIAEARAEPGTGDQGAHAGSSEGGAQNRPLNAQETRRSVGPLNRAASGNQQPGPSSALENVARISASDLSTLGPVVQPRAPQKSWAAVESVEAFNASNHTRIIVKLNDTVTFDSAHLRAPDRIYFDLHQARVGPKIRGKSLDFQSGLLKSLRVGQNKPNTVRIVLNADGARDCSAELVGKPYRLVIDLSSAKAAAPGSPPGAVVSNALAPKTAATDEASSSAGAPAVSAPVTREAVETVTVGPNATKLSPNVARRLAGNSGARTNAALTPPPGAKPTRDGDRSLSRELGLKISRIVIDPGHGGHDTGTIGPHGLMEKDLCLDVALRLGRLIEKNLPGAQVVYTRKDDTFIPLEERTAIANNAKADLFISIHANSSRDRYARGVETYYLNFATSPEAMEVATRENAYSTESIHDLQNLIQKIARNDKIEESKELATDIQDALSHRLELVSASEHNRGVKRAPFVVLIGANMPSVLAEISFLSNATDERLLRKPLQRERIAMGLYRGIAAYLASINSLSYNKQKFATDDRSGAAAVASSPASGPGSRD
jgi:N-acetylmuramoyl-L-alanine amidase